VTNEQLQKIIALIDDLVSGIKEVDQEVREAVDVEKSDERMTVRYELKSLSLRLQALVPVLRRLTDEDNS
jgi:hypothetical protein